MRLVLTAILCFAAIGFSRNSGMTAPETRGAEDKPPMFVLQVGIGKYLYTPKWTDLTGAVTDVVEFKKLLLSERFKVPESNIVTLTDAEGTKPRIISGFRDHLIANARKYNETTKRRDAVVMFQFSGHGSQVPDTDGDEADKLDETLVTHDSQDEEGKNFDVTDDEIFALTAELKKYTDNIVYILDSCHSGSGTRNAEDARRLPARRSVPQPVAGLSITTRSGETKTRDTAESDLLPPGDDYIVITAAASEQLATQKYCWEECGRTDKPLTFGLLTYHLIDELRNTRDDTSYRELMDSVVRKVAAEKPSQTPQLEGDARRRVFGGLAAREDGFTPIAAVNGNEITIRAGAVHGIATGAIVSVYDRSATRFQDAAPIATGRATRVTAVESVVSLNKPQRGLTTSDKAVVVSSDIAGMRMRVALHALDDPDVAARLRETFAPKAGAPDPRGVDIAPASAAKVRGKWSVAVLRDPFSKAFPTADAHKCAGDRQPAPDEPVFYVTGSDYKPLFGFCAVADDDAAVSRIESALVHIARYRAIQAIENKRSRLSGKISVKPIRLRSSTDYKCIDGRFTAERYEPVTPDRSTGHYSFEKGEVFWFEVTNNSPYDLYITLLNLGPDGSVKLHFPRNIVGEKDGVVVPARGGTRVVVSDRCRVDSSGRFLEAGAFRTSGPSGLDRFKFIATVEPTKRDDFAYLEMDAITRSDNISLAGRGEWTAVDVVFAIK